MSNYFLGVDAGATKSHALISDEKGQVVGFGQAGSGNPDWVGQEGFAAILDETLSQALSSGGVGRRQIAGAGFGVAGYDWPSQKTAMLDSIAKLELQCPVELVNDSLIGLMAGITRDWGVAVVAGTSCNAWGIGPDGRYGRMSGYSFLGEYAGSHELVERALQQVNKAWSKRAQPTRLTTAFMEMVGSPCEDDLIEGISLNKYEIGPSVAPLVFQVAAEGDPVAQELVRWAGQELGDLAVGVIRQLDLFAHKFEVVLAGSFYRGSPVIQEEMERVVHAVAPGSQFVPLSAPPVIGGVLFGMKAAGMSAEKVAEARKTLDLSYKIVV
jgi:N-acetylglucosamine kinase-like BadF-type ATPase